VYVEVRGEQLLILSRSDGGRRESGVQLQAARALPNVARLYLN
jgi:hypothetical protein